MACLQTIPRAEILRLAKVLEATHGRRCGPPFVRSDPWDSRQQTMVAWCPRLLMDMRLICTPRTPAWRPCDRMNNSEATPLLVVSGRLDNHTATWPSPQLGVLVPTSPRSFHLWSRAASDADVLRAWTGQQPWFPQHWSPVVYFSFRKP